VQDLLSAHIPKSRGSKPQKVECHVFKSEAIFSYDKLLVPFGFNTSRDKRAEDCMQRNFLYCYKTSLVSLSSPMNLKTTTKINV
jgi:hypothetical protein